MPTKKKTTSFRWTTTHDLSIDSPLLDKVRFLGSGKSLGVYRNIREVEVDTKLIKAVGLAMCDPKKSAQVMEGLQKIVQSLSITNPELGSVLRGLNLGVTTTGPYYPHPVGPPPPLPVD